MRLYKLIGFCLFIVVIWETWSQFGVEIALCRHAAGGVGAFHPKTLR